MAPVPVDAVAAASVSYTVSRVIDGDTVEVTGSDGSLDTIRVIGIDTPEMDACEGTSAKNAMLMFADGKTVTLTMGGDGEDTDRYGRLLRYIDVDGQDVGLLLIDHGFAVARYDSRDGYGRHDREDTYVAADAASPDYLCPSVPAPVAEVPATPETPSAPRAEPTPPASSVYYENCSAVKAAGAAPIHAGDPGWQSKFDRDNDGIGCES